MTAMDDAKRETLRLDLANIIQAARELDDAMSKANFEWSEELFAGIREIRDAIIHL